MNDWESPFTGGPEQYEEFSRFCKNEAEELEWTPRDVEKASFKYGKNKGKIKASSEG